MIRIEVQTRTRQPLYALAADFDERGGTIGRAKESTLVLPDPTQHISRKQAVISFREGSYLLRDNGTALRTIVNGNPIGKDNEVAIRDGDQIDIGEYALAVRLVAVGSAAHTALTADLDPFASSAGSDRRAPGSQTPVSRPGLDADPFANPFGAETPAADRASTEVIPPDFDLWPASVEVASSSIASGDDELHSIQSSTENLDALFGLNDPGLAVGLMQEDPLAAATPIARALSNNPLSAPALSSHRAHDGLPQRNDSHILSTPIPVSQPGSPARADAEALDWGGSRSRQQDDVVAKSPREAGNRADPHDLRLSEPVSVDVQPTSVADRAALPGNADRIGLAISSDHAPTSPYAEELLRAFLAGIGVKDLQLQKGLTPDVMNLVGQLLRESIRGTLELLVARALTKREIRARDITILVARENNPLKYSVTLEAALNKLLAPEVQGFMPPVAAMRDAYRDLRSHQFGVMAGMRAALTGVLERFDPARLEKRLTQRGAMDALMPGGRKARLWETFEQLYSDISKEAEDDFEALFGKAFLKAYEAQIAKLSQEERQG